MNKPLAVLAASLCLSLPPSAEAATTINPMGQIDPSLATTNPSVTDWGRGYKFTVNAADVYVTQLGYVSLSAGDFALVLWDVATTTALAQVSGLGGTASATGWEFFNVAPVALTQGAQYLVTLYGIGTSGYYYSNDTAFQPSGDIGYVTMQYCGGCGPTTFPTEELPDFNYGFADIGYVIGNPATVPLPATGLLLVGAVGAMFRRRRQAA